MYLAKATKDVLGFQGAAGCESQAFERDHGVAAPVREPVITGDHCAHFIANAVGLDRIRVRPTGAIRNWSAARTSSAAMPERLLPVRRAKGGAGVQLRRRKLPRE